MSGLGSIKQEPPQICEICGDFEETRPYGPFGEQICFDCGMADPITTERHMRAHIFGEYN